MSVQPTHGSLFAGIGGFDLGFKAAGFSVRWQVEIEPFCRAILETHFPEAFKFDDVRQCGAHNLGAVDVLTAGFPCQAWFVLENVPGLFSSGEGRDFGIVLNALDELGYGVAWRVLNSQFFGVAQRRRRVFIVGRFGKPCPPEVLFESESCGGNSQTGGEARESVAGALGGGAYGTGRRSEDDPNLAYCLREDPGGIGQGHNTTFVTEPIDGSWARGGSGKSDYPVGIVAAQISASAGHHGHSSPRGDGSDNIIVQQAISSKWAKGSSGPAGDEHHNLTVCIQDARGQRDKRQNGIGIDDSGGPMYTLDGTSQHAVARTNLEHQERSGQQFDSAGKVDGTMRGTNDERSPTDAHRVRSFTGLPQGMDSARYRALGNAVTASVAEWIALRLLEAMKRHA